MRRCVVCGDRVEANRDYCSGCFNSKLEDLEERYAPEPEATKKEEIVKHAQNLVCGVDLLLPESSGLIAKIEKIFEEVKPDQLISFDSFVDLVQVSFAFGYVTGTLLQPTDEDALRGIHYITRLIRREGLLPLLPRRE